MIPISDAQRRANRAALKQLDSYIKVIENSFAKGKPISPANLKILSAGTGTTDPANMLRAFQTMRTEIDEIYDAELLRAAPYRFSHFCEYMVRDEPPAAHHEFLMDAMERVHNKDVMRLAVSLPPGSAKSTVTSIRFSAWHLGRRPNDRWMQGAHTQGFAKDRLGKPVRSFMTEARFKDVFPDFQLSNSSAAADYFEFHRARGYYKAIGVGVGISGYRADIGAIDDPIASREDAESPTIRRKLHDWWEDDFSTRPMPGSPTYIVATRWHEMDLIGYLLDKHKRGKGEPWDVINIPALALENDPLGREPGEGLWPEVFGTKFYEGVRRDSPARKWNSLYQGNPIDEEGGVLKKSDVTYYKQYPSDEYRGARQIKKQVKRITLSVDCAEKATQRSDYTAATVWIEGTDNKHYLVHAARVKKEFGDLVNWIETLADQWDVHSIIVEDRGAGTQYIQIRTATPGRFPVIPISTKQQSKEFRFDGVTPMFSAGMVLFPESGVDWIADLEAELFAFPNGKNDDYVDSVSQYLAYRRERTERRGVRKMGSSRMGRQAA